MNGEYNTPIGTPVVIAPGKIPLVGEYAVLEDGNAVLAAITRHAKAQFVPRMDAMPSVVSEVVKLAKDKLADVSAALPPGSVQVNTDDFPQGSERGGLGTSAATAVAAVGAVFESLGLAIADQKAQILAIAETARRTTQGDLGSGADLAAAAHGGLIRILRQKETAPCIEPLTAPAGLHLVLFSVGQSITAAVVLEGVQQYAKDQPVAFGRAMDDLRDIASRFVDEVIGGNATGAVVAAGRYGEQLAKLAAEAKVPILTDAFIQASELARALGGIAKPTGAGSGKVGVALFATPEAARLFRRACPPQLTPLDGDLDCLGVRCQGDDGPQAPEAVSLYQSSTFEAQPTRKVAGVVCPGEDADTAPVSAAGAACAASEHNLGVTNDVIAAADDEDPTGADDAGSRPMDEDPTYEERSDAPAHTRRRRIAGGAVAALALTVIGWLVFSNPLRARTRSDRTVSPIIDNVGLANVASPPPVPTRPPANKEGPAEVAPPPAGGTAPTPKTEVVATPAPPRPRSNHGRKEPADRSITEKTVDVNTASSQKHPPAPPHGKASSPRAGNLSPDDF